MLRNSTHNFGTVARFFHWATAFIVLFLLGLGLYMEGLDLSTQKLTLYGLHKSFGFLVLGLVALRILWRAANPPPSPLATHKPYEILLARFIHFCLYLGLLGMPLSGWLMSSAADFPHSFFNIFSMPDLIPGKNESIFKLMRLAHSVTAWALIAAIALHAAGALKHHLIDRDTTLRRMVFDRPARGFALLLLLMAGGTALYYLPRPAAESALTNPAAYAEIAESDKVPTGDIVTAPAWTILPGARIAFEATVQGSPFTGHFPDIDGTIHFDPANLRGSSARIAVKTATISSGSPERDDAMRLPAWFAAADFPESVLVVDRITSGGGNAYTAHGRLTIRDVTLDLAIPFTLAITPGESGNNIAKMEASFPLQRLDYGVGQGDWSGTGIVANAVNVRVSLAARAADP